MSSVSAEVDVLLTTLTRPAMGATASVTTDAGPDEIDAAHRTIEALEARWSRFRPESDISRANRSAGSVVGDPTTATVVAVALDAHAGTGGWFDPTMGRQLAALGYRRSLADGWAASTDPGACRATAADVVADPSTGLLDVPDGIDLDLGGVGKGMAADLVSNQLVDAGARVAAVDIGGDVRVRSDRRVEVELACPGEPSDPARIVLRDGGVAMSGPTRRRSSDGRHHLIDPRTGRSATHARVVVVIAASAAGAEMLATAAAVAPLRDAVSLVGRSGATAWLIEADGSMIALGDPARFLTDVGWLGARRTRVW